MWIQGGVGAWLLKSSRFSSTGAAQGRALEPKSKPPKKFLETMVPDPQSSNVKPRKICVPHLYRGSFSKLGSGLLCECPVPFQTKRRISFSVLTAGAKSNSGLPL